MSTELFEYSIIDNAVNKIGYLLDSSHALVLAPCRIKQSMNVESPK